MGDVPMQSRGGGVNTWSNGRLCENSEQPSCESFAYSGFPLFLSNFFFIFLLCLSPSFAVCSDPCGMSTFLIPSPSLLQPYSLKTAALLNRHPYLSFSHSPHHAPHSRSLSFLLFVYSFVCPPLQQTHCIGFAYVGVLISGCFSLVQHAKEWVNVIQKKDKLFTSLYVLYSPLPSFYLISSFVHSLIAPALCAPSTSPPLPVLPPSLSDPRAAIFSGRLTTPVKGLICILCMQVWLGPRSDTNKRP